MSQSTQLSRSTAADTVALVGYLDAAGSDGYRRLYKDPAVELYVAIPADAIVEVSSTAAEQSLVLVRGDASVVWHESMPASGFEPASATPLRAYRWPRP
jgi:hypothetical protein